MPSLIVTLEQPLPVPLTPPKNATGKAMARESDRLDAWARRKDVTPFSELLSDSREAIIAQMKAEGFDLSRIRLPEEHWFDPAAGLATVRTLIDHIAANPNDFKQPNPLLRDLRAIEPVLAAAAENKIRFHFTRTAD